MERIRRLDNSDNKIMPWVKEKQEEISYAVLLQNRLNFKVATYPNVIVLKKSYVRTHITNFSDIYDNNFFRLGVLVLVESAAQIAAFIITKPLNQPNQPRKISAGLH